MGVRSRFGRTIEVVVAPVGRGLARTGLNPDALTGAGLVLAGVGAALVVAERTLAAGLVLMAAGLADILDGAVARARGRASPVGSLYDSVSDRLADGAVLAALAWHVRGDAVLFAVTVTALVGALVTSYTRAKAESLGVDCSLGLLERAERAVLIMAGLVFAPLLRPVLWVLAVGSVATVIQRVLHVRWQLLRSGAADGGRGGGGTSGGRPGGPSGTGSAAGPASGPTRPADSGSRRE